MAEVRLFEGGPSRQYGYHNTFTSHASPEPENSPPTYERAVASDCALKSFQDVTADVLPAYSCDLHFEGYLDVCQELASPFVISRDPNWYRMYVVLHGTQLRIYRPKGMFSRSKDPTRGRLARIYSLQHAEVGIAADWRSGEVIPRKTLGKMMSRSARMRLFQTDPQLFEPMRQWVFRLRVETEQLILSAQSHEQMLDWVEQICMGIDVAPPLEDRNEPRFRSLPRRSRRQMEIEREAQQEAYLGDPEAMERQFIEEQERIFRRMYPNLASSTSTDQPVAGVTTILDVEQDEMDELDREDWGELAPDDADGTRPAGYDPKLAPLRPPMSENSLCRFRRRCAPIMLASSYRASPVIFFKGARYTIDTRNKQLVAFQQRPPKYGLLTQLPSAVTTNGPAESGDLSSQRPGLSRGGSQVTAESDWSQNASQEYIGTAVDEERSSLCRTTSEGSSEAGLDRIDTPTETRNVLLAGKSAGSADLSRGKETLVGGGLGTAEKEAVMMNSGRTSMEVVAAQISLLF